jgi:uridine phosphorylase
MTPEIAWYLGVGRADVAPRVILVGDPGRVDLFARHMDAKREFGGERALRGVTGIYRDTLLTVCSFGMGAPIAAIVMEELAALGSRAFLRAGTVMSVGDVELGELVLAHAAVRGESTSASYVPDGFPAAADPDLVACGRQTLERLGDRYRVGLVASYDGFYTEMLGMTAKRRERISERTASLRELGVVALDMESSAILAVAPALGARAATLCLATVDTSGEQLDPPTRQEAEERLTVAALETMSAYEVIRE